MRWWHTTIVGTLGTTESVTHTFNWRTAPAPDVDQSEANGLVFAGQIRDAWAAFIGGTGATTDAGKILSSSLTYTEVTAAYLEQTVPATVTTHPGKRGPVKDFHPPRAAYLVPTQYAPFAAGAVKGTNATADLPWEVAAAVTLTTGARGPRNRGRVYLGPFGQNVMGAAGKFGPLTGQLATDLGELFVNAVNTASGNRLHIVSRAYDTSIGVNGTKFGSVPDSQRRRRKGQAEAPVVGWAA